MPIRVNGIGTTYIGARDFAADGSYITTEFFTFIFIPVFPIRSYRVRAAGAGRYHLIEKIQPHRRQILCVYGWTLGLVVFLGVAGALAHLRDHVSGIFGLAVEILMVTSTLLLVLWLPLPWILRRLARKRTLQHPGAKPIAPPAAKV